MLPPRFCRLPRCCTPAFLGFLPAFLGFLPAFLGFLPNIHLLLWASSPSFMPAFVGFLPASVGFSLVCLVPDMPLALGQRAPPALHCLSGGRAVVESTDSAPSSVGKVMKGA